MGSDKDIMKNADTRFALPACLRTEKSIIYVCFIISMVIMSLLTQVRISRPL